MKKIVSLLLTPALIIGGLLGVTSTLVNASPAAAIPFDLSAATQTILTQTNQHRADNGEPPLVLNSNMSTVAQNWVTDGQTQIAADTHNPNLGSQLPQANLKAYGENEASGQQPDNVVSYWIASTHHNEALLGTYTDIGIGITYNATQGKYYFVQDFGYYTSTKTVPYSQSNPAVTPVAGGLKVQFSAPANIGNTPITSYDVSFTLASGGPTYIDNVTSSPDINNGYTLKAGATYVVRTRANNSVGSGAWSGPTNGTVPATAPSPPSSINITPALNSVNLTWAANDNGSSITNYHVVLNEVGLKDTSTASTTFTGLAPGTHYTGTILATNAIGSSSAANFAFTTSVTISDPVVNAQTTLVSLNKTSLSWSEGASDGGSAVTAFNVKLYNSTTSALISTNKTSDHTYDITSGLSKGQNYYVTISAVNTAGESSPVRLNFSIPATVPSIPQVTAVLSDVQQITINWTDPADDGGSPVIFYDVQIFANNNPVHMFNTLFVPWVTTTVVDSSDNIQANTTYTVKVTATNSVGDSPIAVSNKVVIPKAPTVPDSPTLFTVLNTTTTTASFAWTYPEYNGGAAISGIRVVVTNPIGTVIADSIVNTPTFSLTGLTRGTLYSVAVSAVNEVGNSTALSGNFTTSLETPSIPGVPTLSLNASGNYNSATANYAAPSDNGGGEIVSYHVTLFKNGTEVKEQDSTTLSTIFTGLDYASTYTIKVTDSNKSFTSLSSSSSPALTTPTPPSLVQYQVAAATDIGTMLVVASPATPDKGTYPVSSYLINVYQQDSGILIDSKIVPAGDANSNIIHTFTGLAPGTQYYATITAESVIKGSSISTNIITTATIPPNNPTDVTVKVTDSTTANVSWFAPSKDGGSPITGYKVDVINTINAQLLQTLTTDSTPSIVIPGLDPATEYTVEVYAVTTAGVSGSTSQSFTTDQTAPTFPTNVTATIGTSTDTVNVTWDAPTNDGGSGVLGYTVTLMPIGSGSLVGPYQVGSQSAKTFSFEGLYRNRSYKAVVTAYNLIGTSSSAYSTSVEVPAVAPSYVSNLKVALSGDVGIQATWEAPLSNGGTPITGYTVELWDGPDLVSTKTTTDMSYIFSGLKPATQYAVSVVAVNSAGSSLTVEAGVETNVVAPTAPTKVTATVNSITDTSVDVNWLPPVSDGGSGVISYVVSLNVNGKFVTSKTVDGNVLTTTFSGLTRGVIYQAEIVAHTTGKVSPSTVSNSVTVPVIAPTVPTNIKFVVNGPYSVTISWDAPSYDGGSPITTYSVGETNGSYGSVNTAAMSNHKMTFYQLPSSSTVTFSMYASNNVGDSSTVVLPKTFLTAPATPPTALTTQQVTDNDPTGSFTRAGNIFTVSSTGLPAGTWVYGYVYPTAKALGWAQVNADGISTFDITSANLPIGEHHLVVLDSNSINNIVVDGVFTIANPVKVTTGTHTHTGTTSGSQAVTGKNHSTSKILAYTGSTIPSGLMFSGWGLLVLGLMLTAGMAYFRRKRGTSHS